MILCPMCAEFHDSREFVLRDRTGTVLAQRNPLPVDDLIPRLPAAAQQWLHNRRVANARQRLELGANWYCPKGHQLPEDFAETRTIVIGLIGSPQTTKTTYLGRLVSEVVDHARLSGLGIHCTLADDESQDYYNQHMARRLEQGFAPAATQPLIGEATTRPLVVRMVAGEQRANLLFFDASGENQQSTQVLAQHNPFLHALDAAIVFVTPKALTGLPAGYPLTGAEAAGPRQMHQVVTNLLRNAAEATGSSGRVELAVRALGGGEPEVELAVSDDGPGISPDRLDQIFDPFFTTKERGTGFGLAIVHRIVQDNGGSIELSSTEDVGTTFRVRFPALPPAAAEPAPTAASS